MILISKPYTQRRKRTGGVDIVTTISVGHYYVVKARGDFKTGTPPKAKDPVWAIIRIIRQYPTRDTEWVETGLAKAVALAKAKELAEEREKYIDSLNNLGYNRVQE